MDPKGVIIPPCGMNISNQSNNLLPVMILGGQNPQEIIRFHFEFNNIPLKTPPLIIKLLLRVQRLCISYKKRKGNKLYSRKKQKISFLCVQFESYLTIILTTGNYK